MVALSVDRVGKTYDGNPALSDVSFAVSPGASSPCVARTALESPR